ncbi:hypothetical protein NUG22_21355, partial [Saccharothrix longispora]|nr:hypothetical protein [Saccharothrix longispora]
MVTNPIPTTISTPPPGGGSGFTMEQSAMDALQQQADELSAGYQEVSSKLSGQTLAGNAFGTVGTFAAEAFNASNGRSVELAGKAASALGLVGEGLKATAQTHLEADRAGGEQFARIEPAEIAERPQGAPAGGAGGPGAPQGPPVTPTEQVPGVPDGGGAPSRTDGPPVTPTADVPGADGTTHASKSTGPETPTGQMPPTPTIPNTPAGTSSTPGGGGSAEDTRAAAARTPAAPVQSTP